MRLRSLLNHKHLMNALLISGMVFCNCLASSAQNNNTSTDKADGAGKKEDKPKVPKITGVYGSLALNNSLQVHVENLNELLKTAKLSEILLHLNGHPLKGLSVSRLSEVGPDSEILIYDLKGTGNLKGAEKEEQQKIWNELLGAPKIFPTPQYKAVYLSIGPENKPIESDIKDYELQVVSPTAYWIYIIAFIFVACALVYLAIKSDLLRDPGPDPKVKDEDGVERKWRKPYSLARTQMALWFFFILASFIFIWLVSTNVTSLTTTVIGLMGISAGTGIAATVIDSNKRGAIDNQKLELDKKRKALQADIVELSAKISASNSADLQAELAKKKEALAQVESDLAKLYENTQPLKSESFFKDILSDDNGVSFHRFQIFAWTLALIVIFITSVYKVLTMPEFDGMLLALMGISSGTYLGFKIPEPKTPPEDKTPPVKPPPNEGAAKKP